MKVIPESWERSLAGHTGHKNEVSVKRGICSTEQYYQLCASTGLPRCSGSPRQTTFLETPATTKFFNSAHQRVLHTRCRQRSYPEPINRAFRLGLCQMSSACSYFCAVLLLAPVPAWPRSFASGDSWAEIFVNKCQERGAKRLVAGDEIASTLPLSCNLSKELSGSLFCAVILFLRWQFGHKSAISMACSLQSSCLFPTPLFQANIQ